MLNGFPALRLRVLPAIVDVCDNLCVSCVRGATVWKHRGGLVLHNQLDGLCNLGSVELRRKDECHVHACSDACRGYAVSVNHHTLANRHGTKRRQKLERKPVGGGAISLEETGSPQQESPGADRYLMG